MTDDVCLLWLLRFPAKTQRWRKRTCQGNCKLSLHGTRDAAQNWAAEFTSLLVEFVFKLCKASTCNFLHDKRGLVLTVHGDDFILIVEKTHLQWLGHTVKKTYDLKVDVLGPDAHHAGLRMASYMSHASGTEKR